MFLPNFNKGRQCSLSEMEKNCSWRERRLQEAVSEISAQDKKEYFVNRKICSDPSLELFPQDSSNKGSQHMSCFH